MSCMPLPSLEVTVSSSLLSVITASLIFLGFHINILEIRHCQCLCLRFFPQSSSNPASCSLVSCRIWVLIIGSRVYLHSWVKQQLLQWEELGVLLSPRYMRSTGEKNKNKLRSGKAKLELIYTIFFWQMQVSFCCV